MGKRCAAILFLSIFMTTVAPVQADTQNNNDTKETIIRIAREAAGKLGLLVGVMGPVCCALGYLFILDFTEGTKAQYGRNMTAEVYAHFVNKMDKDAQIAGSHLFYGAMVCAALGYISHKYILPKKPKKKEPNILPNHIVIPKTFNEYSAYNGESL